MSFILRILSSLVVLIGLGLPVQAADGATVLTVEGRFDGGSRSFSLAELEALGTQTITTSTPWHDGKVTFEGVAFARLMEVLKAQGDTAEVIALNAYSIDVPVDDLVANKAILALKRDGQYMPVSDKGPVFIVYPFDANPALNTEIHYSRSVWQVRSIALR